MAFAAAEGWRRPEIHRLREQLAEHWATTIVSCARAGDPLAYGTDRFRQATHLRAQIAEHLDVLNSGSPDRTHDLGRARETLEKAERKQAEASLHVERAERQRDGLTRPFWPGTTSDRGQARRGPAEGALVGRDPQRRGPQP